MLISEINRNNNILALTSFTVAVALSHAGSLVGRRRGKDDGQEFKNIYH